MSAVFLANTLRLYRSRITLEKGEMRSEADDMLGLMRLKALKGDELLVTLEGEDEQVEMLVLREFLEQNL